MSEIEPKELLILSRPDPTFKRVTREVALEFGLVFSEVEFPQIVRADLVIEVPDNIDLASTMFDFFHKYNIIEFKSQNDPLTKFNFQVNEVRTSLFIYEKKVEYEEVLNLIVSASYPREFFGYMRKRGCRFRTTNKWLYTAKSGGKDITVIVCGRLPLEKRYFEWLLFAPSTSQKWRDFVTMLAEAGERELLVVAQEMRPKEYEPMKSMINEILEGKTEKQQKEHLEDLFKLLRSYVPKIQKNFPDETIEMVEDLLKDMTPAERQKLLLEGLLKDMTPAERQELLEQFLQQDKLDNEPTNN